ncbi:protamine-3 [Molossus molossus]|uniref:Protamine 3 n=1 Tax=Molossus molossus TaxID=27622 RepID=A0A7J8J2N7_MOLMO|nr:protamine-3 [Molossus molossus]KAF6490710.1 protamine 3 [Molossus molossus]
MGSHCGKLGTSHSRGHESSIKKLVACISQDNFSLSSEDEEEEEGEEEEEEEEELPVQGKLLLMEPERQEEGAEDDPVAQQSPKSKQAHS